MGDNEEITLEIVKKYDYSWVDRYIADSGLYDADRIRAHREWLINRVEQLEQELSKHDNSHSC